MRRPESTERLRGVIARHTAEGKRPLINAISYQRFITNLRARVDVWRDIPVYLELPDTDQTWKVVTDYIHETLRHGSALLNKDRYREATDYYASRNDELTARFQSNLKKLYQTNVNLNNDPIRNRHYDFYETAWNQRNKFVQLLRDLEQRSPLLIDEYELYRREMKPLLGDAK